ncbi:AbrB family transcriptional regulator [Sedimentitalea todarodis]|uniref:AbrB family transcriptional regulator n=1 Tax=Sedimentitalea todarodis TaxID=1631240 RepID=A0ABU3VCA1_9RHOB|nr:AbrB family transcriptional regulator [Sedimentitalea todarodis]MDU9003791.1 AbrB family transcriptional regulator [Sedimentitalea todarodis]
MPASLTMNPAMTTLLTILVGLCGACVAYLLSFPAWVLLGPALASSIASLWGLPLAIAPLVRDICFVILGLGIGAGFDPQTGGALLRWPMAFAVLAMALVVTMILCRTVLTRGFGFDRRSATLAAAPGHLSFVLGLATDLNIDVARIAVVQSIRLLFLTISVPFIAVAMGYEFSKLVLSGDGPLPMISLAGLVAASVCVGLLFSRLNFPAPLLLAAMAVSALGHVTEVTSGAVPQELLGPAFLVLGTMIGTRFAGMTRAQFLGSLLAGLSTTLVAVAVTTVAAVPVAMALGMPTAHVLAAFAPGGLETMIALGATMAASPGFVVACHVARLLILIVLIPLLLGRRARS